jgi:hypothetical protein
LRARQVAAPRRCVPELPDLQSGPRGWLRGRYRRQLVKLRHLRQGLPGVANGTPGCTASNCGIASCNANFANCDGNVTNGCEANTTTNIAHCSGCNKPCPNYANANAQCMAGICSMGSCRAGFNDCNMNSTDGCEINTNTDKNNCGKCGTVCPGAQFCSLGNCISDPCVSYGGTRLTVNANIKVCNTPVTWGSWNPALIPAPWTVCTLTSGWPTRRLRRLRAWD